jgi:hypothetical protein
MIAKLIEEDAFLLSFAFATNEFELSLVTHQAGGVEKQEVDREKLHTASKERSRTEFGPGQACAFEARANTAQWPAGGLSKLMP